MALKGIERQRHFLDYTLSSLWRRRGKNFSLVFVYVLMVFALSSVTFFADAVRKEAETLLSEAPELIVQRMMAGRHELIPLSYADTIKSIQGVQSVKPRLWGYYYHPAAKANYTVLVPEHFPYQDDKMVIGNGVKRTWGTMEGDKFYFKSFDAKTVILTPARVIDPETEIVSADLILVSEATFRSLFGTPAGFATDLAVSIRNQKECETIARKIVLALPDTRPILREEILRTYQAVFDWRSGYLIALLGGAVLAFFIFAWDKATGLSAEERTEIGILKAVGWDTSDILLMKFWEGAVISLTSFLLGVTAAYLHVFLAPDLLFEHALMGWAVLYPNFQLKPVIHPYQLAVLFFLTVVPYTMMTIIPTWKVAITDPDTVMRQA
jgi:cell division protein FtsX